MTNVMLGEVLIATIVDTAKGWKVEAPHAACGFMLHEFSCLDEARETITKLVPVPCREYIRFIGSEPTTIPLCPNCQTRIYSTILGLRCFACGYIK